MTHQTMTMNGSRTRKYKAKENPEVMIRVKIKKNKIFLSKKNLTSKVSMNFIVKSEKCQVDECLEHNIFYKRLNN